MKRTARRNAFKQDTRKTAEVKPNMINGKPYRTAEQKVFAKAQAVVCSDGATRSGYAVSFHTTAPARN